MILILVLLSFCIYKLSLTQLSREETSVRFSVLSTKAKDINKIIDTSTRLFVTVVGPSGTGKTEFRFKVMKGRTFYPKIGSVFFFYKCFQSRVREKIKIPSIQIEFVKFDGFDRLRNIQKNSTGV